MGGFHEHYSIINSEHYIINWNRRARIFQTLNVKIMARKAILIVDDEKSQREILDMILSGEGLIFSL